MGYDCMEYYYFFGISSILLTISKTIDIPSRLYYKQQAYYRIFFFVYFLHILDSRGCPDAEGKS